MGCKQDCCFKVLDNIPYFMGNVRIKANCCLVQKQDFRVINQALAKVSPCLLAGGHCQYLPVHDVIDAKLFYERLNLAVKLFYIVYLSINHEVLNNCQLACQP